MSGEEIVQVVVTLALVAMIVAIPFAGWRLRFADNVADRLLAVDMITTLLVGIVILLAVIENTNTTIDTGIALAALSFAGTLTVARYISNKQVN
jgi:multicomponent Na+:H+ antiporter subunit F